MKHSLLRRLIREMASQEIFDEPTQDEMRTEEFQVYTTGVWRIYSAIKPRVRGKHIVLMQLINDPPADVIDAVNSMIDRARRNRDFDPELVRKFFQPDRVMSDLRKMAELESEFMTSPSSDEDVPRFSDDDMTPL